LQFNDFQQYIPFYSGADALKTNDFAMQDFTQVFSAKIEIQQTFHFIFCI